MVFIFKKTSPDAPVGEIEVDSGDKFVCHDIACDNDAKVQEYIRKTQDPHMFLHDIEQAGDVMAHDLFSGGMVACVPASNVCVCSWVCHDLCLVWTLM